MLTRTRSLLRRHIVLVVIVSLFVLTVTTAAAVEKLGGTSMPGAHSFVPVEAMEEMACAECHADVAAELEAGPHVAPALSDCTFCHYPAADAHSSSPVKCAVCHAAEAGEMFAANEAHMGMAEQIGETAVGMSLTCMACHTEIDVKIKSKETFVLAEIEGPGAIQAGSLGQRLGNVAKAGDVAVGSGEQHGAERRTDRPGAHGVCEERAFFGHPVETRRPYFGSSVASEQVRAELIGEDVEPFSYDELLDHTCEFISRTLGPVNHH